MGSRTPFLRGALRVIYDDPPEVCPDCAFAWDLPVDEALAAIEASPATYRALLVDRDGSVVPADGSWNATAYVWHLADLTSSWAERWVQLRERPGSTLVGWDPDELADARGYRALPVGPGLWALADAVDRFVRVTGDLAADTPFEHADWGTGDVADGIRWLAHEHRHHEADVRERSTPH